jgi:capsular polysaccharide biosynthesis protein
MKTKTFKTDNFLTVNPLYLVKQLLIKAPIIVIVTILVMTCTYYLSDNKVTQSYKAVAKIIRYDKKISMPKDVPYKFQNFNYDTALQTIRTRENLSEAIKRLNLDITIEEIYSLYEIKRRKRSDIIEILYTDNTKQKAVAGANVLAEIFLKNFYKVQNAATKEVFVYYRKQKQVLLNELDILLATKEHFNKTNKILSIKIQKDYKYEQLNEVALNMIDTRVLRNEYETKIKEINQKLKEIPHEVQLEYSVRSADKKAIQNKEKELTKLKQKYTQYNPKIKTLKNEIKKMKYYLGKKKTKKNIPDEITYGNNPLFTALIIELSQSKIGIVSSRNRITELLEQQRIIENEIKDLNVLAKKYLIIENKINDKNDLLSLVTKRQNELKIALESSQEDFKFLEKAKEPRYSESNYTKAFVLASGFLTVLFIVGFFILKLFLDFRVKEPFDIENRFNIKLLGLISSFADDKIVKKETLNFITNFTKAVKGKKIVLISSDVSATGKGIVLERLTSFYSNTKQKALYLETVNELSEVTDEITDALIDCSKSEKIDFSKVNIVNEYIHKLYILESEENDYYFSNVDASKEFFEYLANSEYSQVLIEIPSYESSSHMFKNFLSYCDLLLMIFKSNTSSRKKIDQIIPEINLYDLNKVKGVLNVTK